MSALCFKSISDCLIDEVAFRHCLLAWPFRRLRSGRSRMLPRLTRRKASRRWIYLLCGSFLFCYSWTAVTSTVQMHQVTYQRRQWSAVVPEGDASVDNNLQVWQQLNDVPGVYFILFVVRHVVRDKMTDELRGVMRWIWIDKNHLKNDVNIVLK